tara:strand:- start:1067 stop:1822 length:756 start_codon:yes stop_codon:yes gene_type:complete
MAFKTIAETDTLETFRTTFNALSQQDFGDIANLSGAISATNLVDAMNETISIATSSSGFTIADDTSTAQLIGGGDTLTVLGTANQIQSTVTVPDTITFSFPNDVQIPNAFTVLGSVSTLGTIQINGNQISSTDSPTVEINDTLKAGVTTINPVGNNQVESTTGFTKFGSSIFMALNKNIFFEGGTDNAFDTKLTVEDPTAVRAITLPDADGIVALTNTTAYATGSIFASTSTLIIYDSTGSELKRIVGSAT